MPSNKQIFKVNIGDKEVELAVLRPNASQAKDAQLAYNSAFADAVKSGALLRAKLENVLVEQGVWSEEKQEKNDELIKSINEGEQKLAKGGIKLAEAKGLALEMRRHRAELRTLISERTDYESNTAEGQAENARFNSLVSSCTVYNDTGKAVFKNMDDYLNRSTEEAAAQAAGTFANMMYGLDDDYEKNLPENSFLKSYKFVDEDLRLVNKDGQLVDLEGRLVNEEGRYVDADGNFIDVDGNPVSEEGDYKFEFTPFLDDDGNPVELEAEAQEVAKKPAPKKRGRPKKETVEAGAEAEE